MEEDSQENIISLVNSIFNVGEFTKTEFTLEFKITESPIQRVEGLPAFTIGNCLIVIWNVSFKEHPKLLVPVK